MATTTTALSLVNWLLKQQRQDEVTSFASVQASALLDLVNEAMRDVLEGWAWKFDERSDVVIRCLPSFTTTTGTVVNGSTSFSIPSFTGNWIGKNSPERVDGVVAYIAVTDDDTYGSVAFRVSDCDMSGSTLYGNIEKAFPGTTASGTASILFYGFEYALPSTVRAVISVRDQARTLQLFQCVGQQEFEALIPRPLDNVGSDPSIAVLSGVRTFTSRTTDTTNTGAFTDKADYSLTVYPIPGSYKFLNLTYYYRHPELAATTDTISGVPLDIIDSIRWCAYYKSLISGIGNEPDKGFQGLQRLSLALAAKHSSRTVDPFRRRAVRSLDSKTPEAFTGGRLISPYGST